MYDYLVIIVFLATVIYVSPIGRQDVSILSFINYTIAVILIITTTIKFPLPKDELLIALFGAGLLSIFSEYYSIYKQSIYFAYLILYAVALQAFKKPTTTNIILKIFLILSIVITSLELALLYSLSNLFTVESLNEFLANGIDYGFNKGTIALFILYPLLYFQISQKKYSFYLYLIYVSPVLLSMRMGVVAFVATIFVSVGIKRQWPAKTNLLIAWGAILGLVLIAIVKGSFDRLPTYMIAIDVLFNKPFGLGVYQYSDYIQNNYSEIYDIYSIFITNGFTEVWNSAESMFGELIASFGLLGIIVICQYIRMMKSSVEIIPLLEDKSSALLLLYLFMIFSGIAHDYSKLDGFFYFLCGAVAGLVSRFR